MNRVIMKDAILLVDITFIVLDNTSSSLAKGYD